MGATQRVAAQRGLADPSLAAKDEAPASAGTGILEKTIDENALRMAPHQHGVAT